MNKNTGYTHDLYKYAHLSSYSISLYLTTTFLNLLNLYPIDIITIVEQRKEPLI